MPIQSYRGKTLGGRLDPPLGIRRVNNPVAYSLKYKKGLLHGAKSNSCFI